MGRINPIIVIEYPFGMCTNIDVLRPYGYEFFLGCKDIDEQWKRLEELRETGGLIVVQADPNSAMRELLDSYIGEDGFINDCGLKKIHTDKHGDFLIVLFYNTPETMAHRAFEICNKRRKDL